MKECSERVKALGGWIYEVRRARIEHKCFYCGDIIRPGDYYVVETAPFLKHAKKYHPLCFNKVFEGTGLGVKAMDVPSGVKLCLG